MCFLPSVDFVMLKLRKEALEDGAFHVRWSAVNFDHIILAVLSKNEVLVAVIAVGLKSNLEVVDVHVFVSSLHSKNESTASHKQFQIQHNGSTFSLEGWEGEFATIKELTDSLKNFVLKSGSESFTVKKCCFPRHGGSCWRIFPDFRLILPQDATLLWHVDLFMCVLMQNCPTSW